MKREPLAQVYNEMHALLVGVGKDYCRKSVARCDLCPLARYLPAGRPLADVVARPKRRRAVRRRR